MKKLLFSLIMAASVATAFSQTTASPIMRFMPLLSGYNVLAPTNGATIGYGTTNVLFTTYNGQVLYSLTNNLIPNATGTQTSTNIAPDAFKIVTLMSDVNGDINANASLWVYYGNTNLYPVVTTNSMGLYFIPPAGYTNAQLTTAYGGWPLANSAYQPWMYPATTNYYPLAVPAAQTNVVTVTLYRSPTMIPMGPSGPSLATSFPLWETTNAWSFSFAPLGGVTGGCYETNLPTTWLQGAKHVYATVSCSISTVGANGATGIPINQLGILQPQP